MIPGAGQMYAGSILSGIIVMLAMVFFLANWFYLFPLIGAAALWVWAMMDANSKTFEYNEQLLKEGFAEIDSCATVENAGESADPEVEKPKRQEEARAGHGLVL